MRCFIQWWVIFLTSLFGLFMTWKTGFLATVFAHDPTFLCVAILCLYIGASLYIGYQSHNVQKGTTDNLQVTSEVGWYFTELSMGLGLLGTIIGFIIMMNANFSTLTDATQSAKALVGIASGLGVALYVTAFGLCSSLLLKFQMLNFNQFLQQRMVDEEKPLNNAEKYLQEQMNKDKINSLWNNNEASQA